MHLIHNEQVKLRATGMNNFAVALAIGGFAVPILTGIARPELTEGSAQEKAAFLVGIFAAWGAAYFIRRQAERELEKLQE